MAIFIKSLNLLDLALDETKNKSKPKALAQSVSGNPSDFPNALLIALTLSSMAQKLIYFCLV
ncbi:hypothetical protein MARI151_60006 [Maribacter litoralis]|uniref:Uncharacterized protein n=1 Tax=Maribacter litoralis TaxID=2059726 RepID=A0A653VPZ6_9FLAO|nr:hypothetical protein MARI151_60006 [Maribacter litoralis]